MTKLKIKITDEILERSKMCGIERFESPVYIAGNCAISLAVRDIFPNALVFNTIIAPFGLEDKCMLWEFITNYVFSDPSDKTVVTWFEMNPDMVSFITAFDSCEVPSERLDLGEQEFELEIPDYVIDRINIDEIAPLLVNHPTLELV